VEGGMCPYHNLKSTLRFLEKKLQLYWYQQYFCNSFFPYTVIQRWKLCTSSKPSLAQQTWSAPEIASSLLVFALCVLENHEAKSNSGALELFLHHCFFHLTCASRGLLSRLSQALVSSNDKGEASSFFFRMRWMLKILLLSSILLSSFSSSKLSCSLGHSLE
jgi:hypothetical protein